jgi:hypothetical protein
MEVTVGEIEETHLPSCDDHETLVEGDGSVGDERAGLTRIT